MIQLFALTRILAIVQIAFHATEPANVADLKNQGLIRLRENAYTFALAGAATETEARLIAVKNSGAPGHS